MLVDYLREVVAKRLRKRSYRPAEIGSIESLTSPTAMAMAMAMARVPAPKRLPSWRRDGVSFATATTVHRASTKRQKLIANRADG